MKTRISSAKQTRTADSLGIEIQCMAADSMCPNAVRITGTSPIWGKTGMVEFTEAECRELMWKLNQHIAGVNKRRTDFLAAVVADDERRASFPPRRSREKAALVDQTDRI